MSSDLALRPDAVDAAAVRARNAALRVRAARARRRSLRLRLEAMLLCQRLAMEQLDRELEQHLLDSARS